MEILVDKTDEELNINPIFKLYFQFSEAALSSNLAVPGDSVVSASLDIQTHEIVSSTLFSLEKKCFE